MDSLEERAREILSVGERCNEPADLYKLLRSKKVPICYDGFEPSGRIHIAQGIMKVLNVNKLTKNGCTFKIWVADWFAMLNHKMGSDLGKIQKVGNYMLEIWKAAGMDKNVQFLWSSHEVNARAGEYWSLVFDIARQNTLARLVRCVQIMGRNNISQLYASAFLYACMQCGDVFFLKADICQLGEDQTKVNMLAREYAQIKKHKTKPVILSHHMLPGLIKDQVKMSKSNPDSAIYMDDSEAEVTRKIQAGHPPSCLEYVKYIVIPWNGTFEVQGGDGSSKSYSTSEELFSDWESGSITEDALKSSLARALNGILLPVRDRLKEYPQAAALVKEVIELADKEAERKKEAEKKKKEAEKNQETEKQPAVHRPPVSLSTVGQLSTGDLEFLREKFPKDKQPTFLISFEPARRLPIAQGMMVGIVNKLIDEGFNVKILIHDWLVRDTTANLQTVANGVVKIWMAKGMRMDQVELIWTSKVFQDLVPSLFDVSVQWDLCRIFNALGLPSGGSTADDEDYGLNDEQKKVSPALILDACIHCASLVHFKPDICLLVGMDKPLLVSSYFDEFKLPKPLMLKPAGLFSLDGSGAEMSTSIEASSLFFDDSKNELKKKIKRAFCPPLIIENNPCLDLVRHVLLPGRGCLTVLRRPEHGGDRTYENMEEVEAEYSSGALHPQDLKSAIMDGLSTM